MSGWHDLRSVCGRNQSFAARIHKMGGLRQRCKCSSSRGVEVGSRVKYTDDRRWTVDHRLWSTVHRLKGTCMKNFDPKYNELPKTEIHCHLEGSIRTQTIIDVAQEYNLKLPAYEVSELDKHVKVYDQLRDLETVLKAFTIFQNSITSPNVVERIAWELFEDSAKQNIKLFEVRFSPDWAFRGHNLNWDEALDGILRAKERAEHEFDMAIGLIAITSRSLGPDSCVRTMDWAIRQKGHILGIDLADSERDFPLPEFVPQVMKAKEAGLKVTIHTGEDTPGSFVKETIKLAAPDRIGRSEERR